MYWLVSREYHHSFNRGRSNVRNLSFFLLFFTLDCYTSVVYNKHRIQMKNARVLLYSRRALNTTYCMRWTTGRANRVRMTNASKQYETPFFVHHLSAPVSHTIGVVMRFSFRIAVVCCVWFCARESITAPIFSVSPIGKLNSIFCS